MYNTGVASIVIHTAGTLGDHLPYIALGQALKGRGHQVLMVINQAMQAYAQRLGLDSIALTDIERGPEEARQNAWAWDHWNYPEREKHPKAQPMDPVEFVTQIRELVAACTGADLLLATSIRPHGYIAAAALGLPWLTVSMNPFTFRTVSNPQEREAQDKALFEEYSLIKNLIEYTFDSLKVEKPAPEWAPGWMFARHVLLASSPHFSSPDLAQFQPHTSIDMTGFWFYQDPEWDSWQPDEKLRHFCEPQDPEQRPIVLTFSSQPLEDARLVLENHVKAAAILGRPMLVLRGWAGFSEADLPPDIDPGKVMFADFLPHDWLFARAACTVQHGGIGSIARALRQGCPMLIEPFGNDQLFNALQVSGLGAGVAMHPFKTSAETIATLLYEKVLVPETRLRAQEIGASISLENGLETACEYVEKFFGRLESGGILPAIYQRFSPPLTPRKRSAPAGYQDDSTINFPGRAYLSPSATQPDSTESQAGPRSPIPKILHQTWKNRQIPLDLQKYQRTWMEHHPDWTYTLWTDEDNRELIRQVYTWFLPIYDSYVEPIKRADAARYFILHHFGGVYVDLDFECLRPIEPLLGGKQVVFGLEPEEHWKLHFPGGAGLKRIISNAFMASAPGHPFWDHVHKQLVAFHLAAGPLDATGPFLLTRAYESFPQKQTISLEPSELLFPLSSQSPLEQLSSSEQEAILRNAYAIHYWVGTWWKPEVMLQQGKVKATLLLNGKMQAIKTIEVDQVISQLKKQRVDGLISCMMVTKNRPRLAKLSVRCFMGQTYLNKELVIVDDGADDELEAWVKARYTQEINEGTIRYVRLPAAGRTLGELRNTAVHHASGEFLAQWDDDDLSDPKRLEIQLAALAAMETKACFLERHRIWWPAAHRLAISNRRIWESSFVCARGVLGAYPELRRGEDTPVIERMIMENRVVLLDYPQLYTYVFHGENTFESGHWEAHWRAATETFEGEMYKLKLGEMEAQLKLDSWSEELTEQAYAGPASVVSREKEPTEVLSSPTEMATSAYKDTRDLAVSTILSSTTSAKILILTPIKDARDYLDGFWANLRNLTYPHEHISLAFIESDSLDGTYEYVQDHLPSLRKEFARVEIFKHDFAYRSEHPRWEPGEQLRRRSIMAKSRNYLLARALQDEEWVLWIDVDLVSWPSDVIESLLAAEKDIVVPNCLVESSQTPFDMNTFKLKPGADKLDWTPYIMDGILQPPNGFGRTYLSDLRHSDLVEVDGVGGTMLLVRADLHREGLVFPTFPYKHLIETEGLAAMARDMGYQCWGLPNLEIYHPRN